MGKYTLGEERRQARLEPRGFAGLAPAAGHPERRTMIQSRFATLSVCSRSPFHGGASPQQRTLLWDRDAAGPVLEASMGPT